VEHQQQGDSLLFVNEVVVSSFRGDIQDMAFDGRARNPLFFDLIYNHLRPDHELRMNEKANEIVDAALANREQWK
jgi:hypothetical protein